MARGQAGAANKQLATTNAAAGAQGAEAGKLEAGLIPKYESMMNEGYNPEELNAMRTAGLGSEAASADTAKWAARNRATATNNSAGLGAEESQLARDKGVTMGNTAADIEMANANARLGNQKFALQGEQGLYGTNTGAMESLYGMGPATLQARAAGKSGDELGMGWVKTLTGQPSGGGASQEG